MTFRPLASLLALTLLTVAPAPAQSPRASTPEEAGAVEGRVDGRRQGLETGRDHGRSQVLMEAWLRGFRRGLTQDGTWRRDASFDEGVAEGLRPGRALGLEAGHERGRQACEAAYLRLEGRPPFLTEAPPPPPGAPPPPGHPACVSPPILDLRFSGSRTIEVDPRDCEQERSPLGWDVPRPDYPDESSLRDRGRLDGHEGDALQAWVDGYYDAFRIEHESAFRAARDQIGAHLVKQWEDEGEVAGRGEGARRHACSEFVRGHAIGFRDGWDEGFDRGFGESWDAADREHSQHEVVRILSASLRDESNDGVIEPGEGVVAEVELANAGLRDAEGDVLRWDGVLTVTGRGAVTTPLRSQARRTEVLDLGRAGAGAPFGAGIEVGLQAARGDAITVAGSVGRPVVLGSAIARHDVADGRLVTRVIARVDGLAKRDTDRDLAVAAGSVTSALGIVRAGERREVELVVDALPSSLAEESRGEIELRSGNERWMLREWTIRPDFGESLVTAARLPPGSSQLNQSLTSLSRRLMAEVMRAMDDPKLYQRLEGSSDLAGLARVLPGLPADALPHVDAVLLRPLRAVAEAKATPRKVRRAIKGSGVF